MDQTTMITTDLRPAEALFLMSEARQEIISPLSTLQAILAYLAAEGFLEVSGDTLAASDRRTKDPGTLREYEQHILDSIGIGNPASLIHIVQALDMHQILTGLNYLLFECKQKPCSFRIWRWTLFSWTEDQWNNTSRFESAIDELKEIRERIRNCVESRSKLDEHQAVMAYAFPSISKMDGYGEYMALSAESIPSSGSLHMADNLALSAWIASIQAQMDMNRSILMSNTLFW